MIRSWLFVPLWNWLCDAGHVMVLATFLVITWLGIKLDSFTSLAVLFVLLMVVDRKIERPLRALVKPSWYLAVLNLNIMVGIVIVSMQVEHLDDGKDEVYFRVSCDHHP